MINKTFYSIFQQGSKTMFYSSIFFPKNIRKDVFVLYGFVRTADDLVDTPYQDKKEFFKFKEKYMQSQSGITTGDIVIDSFAELEKRKNFDLKWTEAFLNSMEMDLTKKTYETVDEVLEYVYGAAEVMGLYMVNILGLDKKSYFFSRYLGRALQCINAIRDIAEDLLFSNQCPGKFIGNCFQQHKDHFFEIGHILLFLLKVTFRDPGFNLPRFHLFKCLLSFLHYGQYALGPLLKDIVHQQQAVDLIGTLKDPVDARVAVSLIDHHLG